MATGGQSGPAFIAGSPAEYLKGDESLIVAKRSTRRVMQEEHPAVLTDDELQTLVYWIAAGAKDN